MTLNIQFHSGKKWFSCCMLKTHSNTSHPITHTRTSILMHIILQTCSFINSMLLHFCMAPIKDWQVHFFSLVCSSFSLHLCNTNANDSIKSYWYSMYRGFFLLVEIVAIFIIVWKVKISWKNDEILFIKYMWHSMNILLCIWNCDLWI